VITRLWRGWAGGASADAYERLLRSEVLPAIDGRDGYRGVYVLRRDAPGECEFVTLTLWRDMDAARAFSGDDRETAVVPDAARRLLARFDDSAAHFQTIPELEVAPQAAAVARTWRGWTSLADADEYVEYLLRTGIAEYRDTPGNRAAHILRRPLGSRAEFVTLTFWGSLDDVRAFAGDPVETAVFYPEDDRFLADRETTVSHYRIVLTPAG
jgi:heme-degrading monooxygenase HmoA